MYSLWQKISHGTINFDLVTLTLKFDLLLKTLTLAGIYLWLPTGERSCLLTILVVGVMPLLEPRILKIHSCPHFSLTCFDILSWNFAYDFYCTTDPVRVSSIRINICWGNAPIVTFFVYCRYTVEYSALFSYMLWHFELKFCKWLCFTVLQIKLECCIFATIFVGLG